MYKIYAYLSLYMLGCTYSKIYQHISITIGQMATLTSLRLPWLSMRVMKPTSSRPVIVSSIKWIWDNMLDCLDFSHLFLSLFFFFFSFILVLPLFFHLTKAPHSLYLSISISIVYTCVLLLGEDGGVHGHVGVCPTVHQAERINSNSVRASPVYNFPCMASHVVSCMPILCIPCFLRTF